MGDHTDRRNRADGPSSWPTVTPSGIRGADGLLDRQSELRHAKALHAARAAFAESILALPASLRSELLEHDPDGPRLGHNWPLASIEICAEKLGDASRKLRNAGILSIVRRARRHKHAIDTARNVLIVNNLSLVSHVARQFDSRQVTFADRFQEGTIGLITAVERFEWERGHKFSTYAYWWIRNAISKAIATQAALIRLPSHIRSKLRRYHDAREELASLLGRDPLPAEIAQRMKLTFEQLNDLIGTVRDPHSIDESGGDDVPTYARELTDPNAPTPLDHALDREVDATVAEAMGELNPREREILLRRFGIEGDAACTLQELGRMLRLSRERVRQIERSSLAKMTAVPAMRELLHPDRPIGG